MVHITKIDGTEVGERRDDETYVTVDRWYDRKTRSWVVQKKDADGNQVGNADYVGRKSEAISLQAEYLRAIRPTNVDPNAKHKVLEAQVWGRTVSVYMLNPGQFFEGFGGSRHAQPVTKTASLITRETGSLGLRDHESDIYSKEAWAFIRRVIRQQLADELGVKLPEENE